MDDLLGNIPAQSKPETRSLVAVEEPRVLVLPVVQHAADNPSLEMDNGVRWERLSVGEGGPAEPLLVSYSPGASSSIEGKLMRHSGFEYAYILEGKLTLQLEFETYILSPGDSLQFDSVRPHIYTNKGSVTARGVWHVVGRRQQNQEMPTAPESAIAQRKVDNPKLNSAVDVLQAMDNLECSTRLEFWIATSRRLRWPAIGILEVSRGDRRLGRPRKLAVLLECGIIVDP
jgi:quercetin dioxygenase-like cupin family protein